MKNPHLTKKDIIAVNQQFADGHFENESSLDYALHQFKQNIAWTKQLSFLVRAILVDHVFEEGNKRTALAVLVWIVKSNGYEIEEQKAVNIIKTIVTKNIKNIKKIRELIENAITSSN